MYKSLFRVLKPRISKNDILVLALAPILSSCASNARFDSDRYTPAYYRGGNRIFVPYLGASLRAMVDSGSDTGGFSNHSKPVKALNQRSPAEEDAAVGVLLSGLSLLINRDYYQSSYLGGNCICQASHSSFDIPCSNILVALYDRNGKELSRILSEDGEFVFPVQKDKEYRLGIVSNKYELTQRSSQPLKMGDNVVLRLAPKAVKSAE